MILCPKLSFGAGLLLCISGPLFAETGQAPSRDVYVVPFSHLDLYWAGTKEECLGRGNRIISKALQLAKENSSFRFLIEANVFLANYADSHKGTGELADLRDFIRKGQIQISPQWTGIMLDLPDGEVIARDFAIGKRYAREEYGVDPQTANLADLPAFPTQVAQILVLARTPNAVITRLGPKPPLFNWTSPDGSRVRCWYTPRGYNWGATLGLHDDLNPQRLAIIGNEVQMIGSMTDAPLMMHWGIDLYVPSSRVLANLPQLNDAFQGHYRFRVATLDDYFRAVSSLTDLPELTGEIPSCWPNIVSSLPNLWPAITPATSVLKSAEKFATINYSLGYSDYPDRKFEFLWKKLIEACDHNQDGQGGFGGDKRKEEYASLVLFEGGEVLRESLRNIAERVRIPSGISAAVIVFNPDSWKRDDVVHAHVTVYGDVVPTRIDDYRRGFRLVDESGAVVPFTINSYSENISRAYEVTFVAHAVPSLGYKTYYLQPATEKAPSTMAAEITLDSANDKIDPRRPFGSDIVENDYYRLSIDKATGFISVFDKELQCLVVKDMQIVAREERGGNYSTIEPLSGRTIPETIDAIDVEQNDCVSATMRIQGTIADIGITQRLTLFKALKRIDVQNTVSWSKVRYLRLEQLIPYQISNPKLQYGVPFGSNDASNIVPDSGPRSPNEISRQSWINGRLIHDWISAAGPDWELSVATDHPFVRFDDGILRAQMLHGTKFTTVRVVDQNGPDSMHYPQPGIYTFKYALTSNRGDWVSNKSYRFGNDFNSDLIAVSATDELAKKELPPSHSFLEITNDSVVLSALKKENDGNGVVARFYEIEGKRGDFELRFDGKTRSTESLNFLEERMMNNQPAFGPFEIKTLRLAVRP